MLKHFFSAVFGFLIAMLCIMAIQVTSRRIWPPPEGLSKTSDREALRIVVDSMPPGQLVTIALGFVAGAFVGGVLASKLSGSRVPAYAIGGFVIIGVIGNMMTIPYPAWFWLVELLLVPAAALLAARIGVPANTPTD